MKRARSLRKASLLLCAAGVLFATPAGGDARRLPPPVVNVRDLRLVNMIPVARSNETHQDSEPYLAVNPAHVNQLAASAFTSGRGFCGADTAPIYVSADGGNTWAMNCILPSNSGLTSDITLSFSGVGSTLYAAILRHPGYLLLNVLRTTDFISPGVMTVINERESEWVDHPHIHATQVGGKEHVLVGSNYLEQQDGKSSVVEYSLDAGASSPTFRKIHVEARDTAAKNGPPTRIAVHPGGTLYAAFYGWRGRSDGLSGFENITTDVVVVRDDGGGDGQITFTDLKDDGGDGLPGRRVVRDRIVPKKDGSIRNFGFHRLLSTNISIAVDPRPDKQGTVYLAWADREGANDYTLHVRRSTDGGRNWSEDLRKVSNATNPAVAVNQNGEVGFLYQKLAGGGASQQWETHLELTSEASAFSEFVDIFLARTPASPQPETTPFIGDYIHLTAVGKDFYGIFSANNTPDPNSFPAKLPIYSRNHNFTEKRLLSADRRRRVLPSIDPFFFKVLLD